MSAANVVLSAEPTCHDEPSSLGTRGRETLAGLFLEYRDRLERMIAFRLDPRLLGRVDPADVMQEAYIEAVRRIDGFVAAPCLSPFVWLRQITWQTLLNVHRRHLSRKRNAAQEVSLHSRRHDHSTNCPLALQLPGGWTSPSQAAMRNERTALLRLAIARMDDLDREILALRHFEQLSNGETAEVLNITKTAASNRYIRALKRLRVCLEVSAALSDT